MEDLDPENPATDRIQIKILGIRNIVNVLYAVTRNLLFFSQLRIAYVPPEDTGHLLGHPVRQTSGPGRTAW